ncbi:MAG TPA: hypothetical protein VFS20_16820 [Longimicrobium sp.]|nr:hypothetical protein [Longimicrobium sp.]
MKRLAAVTVLLFAACNNGAPATTPPRGMARDSADLWAERGAVMPDSVVRRLTAQCSRPTPDSAAIQGLWTPTAEQVRDLEARLTPLLRSELTRQYGGKSLATRLAWYHRQYGGLVLNGRRIIYVNGFLPGWRYDRGADTVPWRQFPVWVCDGGIGYFGVEYDPATKRFRNLAFNGVA